MERGGCIYIMTNKTHSVLYVGVTSDLIGRIWQHKNKAYPDSFTANYNCNKLIYYEMYPCIEEAVLAEKLLKGGSRAKKIELVNTLNPEWNDLYKELLSQ